MDFVHHVHDELVKFLATHNMMPFQAFIVATTVAVCRSHKQGAINWFEAILCGVFAWIAYQLGNLAQFMLPIPIDLTTSGGVAFMSGFIGYKGTDKVVEIITVKVGKLKNGNDSERVRNPT